MTSPLPSVPYKSQSNSWADIRWQYQRALKWIALPVQNDSAKRIVGDSLKLKQKQRSTKIILRADDVVLVAK